MSKKTRNVHVPGGLYYVRMRVNTDQALVLGPQDAQDLERLAAEIVRLYRARVLAAYWGRERGDLLVEVDKFPIWDVMRYFCGAFAQRAQARRKRRGSLFRRYRKALVITDGQLLLLVRYIHQMPATELARRPEDYPYSTYRRYIDTGIASWVHTGRVRSLLARRNVRSREDYERWMAQPVSGSQAILFETATGFLPSRTAEPPDALLDREDRRASNGSPDVTTYVALDPAKVEPIVEIVSEVLGLTPKQIRSRDSTQPATLARALVAWNGCREGLGSRSAFAKYLGERACSTIDRAIDRYAIEEKDLFAMSLEQLKGLARRRKS